MHHSIEVIRVCSRHRMKNTKKTLSQACTHYQFPSKETSKCARKQDDLQLSKETSKCARKKDDLQLSQRDNRTSCHTKAVHTHRQIRIRMQPNSSGVKGIRRPPPGDLKTSCKFVLCRKPPILAPGALCIVTSVFLKVLVTPVVDTGARY